MSYAHDDQGQGFWASRMLRTTLLAVAAGVIYALTLWALRDAISSIPALGSSFGAYREIARGPATIWLLVGSGKLYWEAM